VTLPVFVFETVSDKEAVEVVVALSAAEALAEKLTDDVSELDREAVERGVTAVAEAHAVGFSVADDKTVREID